MDEIVLLSKLFSDEPFNTIFLCIVLIGCIYKFGMRDDLVLLLTISFRQVCRLFSWGVNVVKQDTRCIDPRNSVEINNELGRFFAWAFMFLFSILAAYFIVEAMILALFGILNGFPHGQFWSANIGLMFFVVLGPCGYWYRCCAYRVARENGINLTPWR